MTSMNNTFFVCKKNEHTFFLFFIFLFMIFQKQIYDRKICRSISKFDMRINLQIVLLSIYF